MKIISENSRLLDELANQFTAKKIEEEKNDGGMGAFETIALILDVLVPLIEIYEFLDRKFPDWKLVFVPRSDEVEMTPEKYDNLSENAKKAILEHYSITIIKK